jgi:hypothetical protein
MWLIMTCRKGGTWSVSSVASMRVRSAVSVVNQQQWDKSGPERIRANTTIEAHTDAGHAVSGKPTGTNTGDR